MNISGSYLIRSLALVILIMTLCGCVPVQASIKDLINQARTEIAVQGDNVTRLADKLESLLDSIDDGELREALVRDINYLRGQASSDLVSEGKCAVGYYNDVAQASLDKVVHFLSGKDFEPKPIACAPSLKSIEFCDIETAFPKLTFYGYNLPSLTDISFKLKGKSGIPNYSLKDLGIASVNEYEVTLDVSKLARNFDLREFNTIEMSYGGERPASIVVSNTYGNCPPKREELKIKYSDTCCGIYDGIGDKGDPDSNTVWQSLESGFGRSNHLVMLRMKYENATPEENNSYIGNLAEAKIEGKRIYNVNINPNEYVVGVRFWVPRAGVSWVSGIQLWVYDAEAKQIRQKATAPGAPPSDLMYHVVADPGYFITGLRYMGTKVIDGLGGIMMEIPDKQGRKVLYDNEQRQNLLKLLGNPSLPSNDNKKGPFLLKNYDVKDDTQKQIRPNV